MRTLDIKRAPDYRHKGKPARPTELLVGHFSGVTPKSDASLAQHIKIACKGHGLLSGPLYTYVVTPRGTIVQCCAENVKTNNAGRIDMAAYERALADLPPRAPSDLKPAKTSTRNAYTISVSLMWSGKPGDITLPQYQSFVAICHDICQRRDLDPLTRFVTHDILAGWRKIDFASVLDPTKVAADIKSGRTPSRIPLWKDPATGKGYTRPPTLRRGIKSAHVVMLRKALKAAGIRIALSENTTFGKPLEAAVRKFQARESLDTDGIVGKDTWAALQRYTEPQCPKPAEPPTVPPPFTSEQIDYLQEHYGS